MSFVSMLLMKREFEYSIHTGMISVIERTVVHSQYARLFDVSSHPCCCTQVQHVNGLYPNCEFANVLRFIKCIYDAAF